MIGFIRSVRAIFWVARIGFRFLSGRPMSGERKTDATFWRPATHSLDPSKTALRWEMMRGASRAAWRTSVSYLLLLWPISLLISSVAGSMISLPWYASFPFLLWSHVLLLAGGSAAYVLRRFTREYGYSFPVLTETDEGKRRISLQRVEGRREWHREKVLPLARSASMILGTHIPERKAHEWVTVPKNYMEGGSVEIRLPSSFPGDAGVKKRLASAVSQKLGIHSPSATWQTEGSAPRVLFSAPPVPPELVSFSDVEDLLLESEEYRPLLGLQGDSAPLVAEMIDDSPHIALSAGPGAGKSTLAKLVMMQALYWGWGVVVLDWKQTEAYSWLGGLPGVTYLSSIEAIHDMGVRIAQEVDIRKESGMAGRAKVLINRDEWNVTAMLLQSYWSAYRASLEPEERRTTPVKSPALEGYAVLDFAGREYGLFDLCIAQRFSARAFNGNADIRECFQIKLMARYSAQTVKMLAPDIKPFPRKSNHQGRWAVVIGDEATVVQAPFITNSEARTYALSGQEGPTTPFGTHAPGQRGSTHNDLGKTLPHGATPSSVPSTDPNLTLKELAPLVEHLDIPSEKALRHHRDRDPTFPVAVSGDQFKGYRYSRSAVMEWARIRHAQLTAEKAAK